MLLVSMTRGVSELHFQASPRGQDKRTNSEYGQTIGERVALVDFQYYTKYSISTHVPVQNSDLYCGRAIYCWPV